MQRFLCGANAYKTQAFTVVAFLRHSPSPSASFQTFGASAISLSFDFPSEIATFCCVAQQLLARK